MREDGAHAAPRPDVHEDGRGGVEARRKSVVVDDAHDLPKILANVRHHLLLFRVVDEDAGGLIGISLRYFLRVNKVVVKRQLIASNTGRNVRDHADVRWEGA